MVTCSALDLALQSAFQLIPKVFDGVEVSSLEATVMFFHTDYDKPLLYGPRFVNGGILMLKQERAFHKVGSTESSRMYADPLRCSFNGTKVLGEKQPQSIYSSFTKLYSWHYVLGQVAFSWHLPNPDLSVELPDGEA